MSLERREQLAEELSTALRGLEDQSIRRIQAIFMASLRTTIKRIYGTLERIANQPEYDPGTTPGAFLGSTPDGVVEITPETKNAAALYLQGQLVQDLRRVLDNMQLSPALQARLDQELTDLFNTAQDISTEYGLQMIREAMEQPLAGLRRPAPGGELPPGPDGAPPPPAPYQEGQRFTRLLDIYGAVAAAERDFKSLADNYAMQRDMATSGHVAAAKAYYEKWWRHWGDTVAFMTGREMAAGPDPRRLKKVLQERIPTINEAFRNRAATIARTETLIASGEAQERNWRQLRVGFVQYMATLDERVCEWCAPRAGCLYWIGGIKTPIHPNCRCALVPITLEGLAIENQIADDGETWEAQAQKLAADTRRHFEEVNGEGAKMRPTGGPGEGRGPRDFPLMERTRLPATRKRSVPVALDPAGKPWPAGSPVWCPRRGWLDPYAEATYRAITRQVAEL